MYLIDWNAPSPDEIRIEGTLKGDYALSRA